MKLDSNLDAAKLLTQYYKRGTEFLLLAGGFLGIELSVSLAAAALLYLGGPG